MSAYTDAAQTNAITASWSYPYKLKDSSIVYTSNSSYINTISTGNEAKSSAEFFLFTGITAMLLAFAFIVFYIFMAEQYRNNPNYPTIDFTITLIWTIFWIAASSAWAQGVTIIRSQTSWDNIQQRVPICSGSTNTCAQSGCKS